MAAVVGGVDVAQLIVNGIRSERPLVFAGLVFAGLVLVGVVVVAYGVLSTVGFVWRMRRALDEEVHTRGTDTDVRVTRTGSGYRQSSGMAIPFDAITSVEYLDPDESSTRIEFGDWRSKQFSAGRSTDWVRIGRDGDSTVYIGSGRPMELAEAIARSAPDVERAKPF